MRVKLSIEPAGVPASIPIALHPCACAAVSRGVDDPQVAVTMPLGNQADGKVPFRDTFNHGLGDIEFPTSCTSFTLETLAREFALWVQQTPLPMQAAVSGKPENNAVNVVTWFGILGAALLLHPGLRRRL